MILYTMSGVGIFSSRFALAMACSTFSGLFAIVCAWWEIALDMPGGNDIRFPSENPMVGFGGIAFSSSPNLASA